MNPAWRKAIRPQIVVARKVKSFVAYPFSKRVRNFFVENKLGKTEVDYFQKCLKVMKNEVDALDKLKTFIGMSPAQREETLKDEFELMSSMSFRLGERKQRPMRTQPKKKRTN